MKIMCLNGWGGTKHAQLAAYVAQEQPDVLCLQEVVHSPQAGKNWLEYRDGAHILPQRANFFEDVRKVLPRHMAWFCPAARGVLWDGTEQVVSYWGLASFVRADIAVVGQAQGFVHKHYEPHGYGAHPRSRSAHALRLHEGAADRMITVTHMHGLRDLRGKMDTPERSAQAQKLLALHGSISAQTDLQIICGDFNVMPNSGTLHTLRDAGFTELVTTRGHNSTRTSLYTKPARFADYMCINDPAQVHSFDVVTAPEVSDHCPLVLTL